MIRSRIRKTVDRSPSAEYQPTGFKLLSPAISTSAAGCVDGRKHPLSASTFREENPDLLVRARELVMI
jgi:hypothetical protein